MVLIKLKERRRLRKLRRLRALGAPGSSSGLARGLLGALRDHDLQLIYLHFTSSSIKPRFHLGQYMGAN